MDCDALKEQLGPYLDGELPADARGGVEAHLATCPACADELESLRLLAASVVPQRPKAVPQALWTSIEERLDDAGQAHGSSPLPCEDGRRGADPRSVPHPSLRNRWVTQVMRKPVVAAAGIALVAGMGILAFFYPDGGTSRVEGSTIDFGALLDALPLDARNAFRSFLDRYEAEETTVAGARRHGAALNFAIPDSLPGGFRLEAVYALRFGDNPGLAAEYSRDDEFLATIFHPPVRREDFGTHKDYPCAVGMHRGHTVEVGSWKLVHLTDPTTCHCLLSQLETETQLHAVFDAVVPDLALSPRSNHDH